VKSVRGRKAKIRVDAHGHYGSAGSALEEIKIANVEAWIFFRELGIEVVRHVFPLLDRVVIVCA
jgi:hypothetical protein